MSVHETSESPPDIHDEEMDLHEEDDRLDGDDPDTQNPANAATNVKRPKRSRACQACRAMKIRCLPVEGQEACKACSKVNRTCVMPGPARKRQKTVHKVAELEKKIDALTASLAAKVGNSNANKTGGAMASAMTVPTPPNDSPATTGTPSNKANQYGSTRVDKEYSWEHVVEKKYPDPMGVESGRPIEFDQDSTTEDYEDIITRGIIDEESAARFYIHWRDNMAVYSPIVAYPESTTIDWLRQKRPMTLLSIFIVGAGTTRPEIQPDLAVEISRQLADRVMFYNEKSLDLVQAMLIYSSWYGKHKYAKDLAFNNLIHSSVAMCLDLGYGKRSRNQVFSDTEDAEVRRTWMACYYMASSVATVLRLPPLVKFSPYLEECLEAMDTHPGALASDKTLCALVRLARIKQDVGSLFHMDDPGSNIPLDDSRTQFHLKMFERQLSEWVEATRPYLPKATLAQCQASSALYIHEIALHSEHNVDDFRPMYRATGRETQGISKDFLTNAHFEAVAACVDAMNNATHAFLEMDDNTLRCVPSLHIVWCAYVTVAMIRLHGILAVPDSKYGSIFLPKLNIIAHLDAIIQRLTSACRGHNIPADSFVLAFKKLKAWHIHRTVQLQQHYRASGQLVTTGIGIDQHGKFGDTFIQFPNGPAAPFSNGPATVTVDDLSCPATSGPRLNSTHRTSSNASNVSSSSNPVNHNQNPNHSRSSISHPQYQQHLPPQTVLQPYPSPQFSNPMPGLIPSESQSTSPNTTSNILSTMQIQGGAAPSMPQTTGTTISRLLDPNAPIDASTFDIQNWDFSVGEMDNFENYLNDAGWMGYLM